MSWLLPRKVSVTQMPHPWIEWLTAAKVWGDGSELSSPCMEKPGMAATCHPSAGGGWQKQADPGGLWAS